MPSIRQTFFLALSDKCPFGLLKKTVEKHFPMIGKAYTAFLNKTRTKMSNESRKSAVTTL